MKNTGMMNRIRITNDIEVLQFSRLGTNRNIFHFVTTRKGGVGKGMYESLNLGEFCGDDPEVWQQNRHRFCDAVSIPEKSLFVPFQTHGARLLDIDSAFMELSVEKQKEQMHGVDALVTSLPEVSVAVTTADCVPLLVYAPDKQVVAAIHAGWRGTAENIAGRTTQYMIESYGCDPAKIEVGIGPCIQQEAFEVGEEVVHAFGEIIDAIPEVCMFNSRTGKKHLDLSRINQYLLMKEGVPEQQIELSGICTNRNKEVFFSARREGIASGRMITGIMIKKQ